MECERWREAISARVDGEPGTIEERLVAAHQARCAGCQEFEDTAWAAKRSARMHVAPTMPDLSGRITRQVVLADRRRPWNVVRSLLAVVAAQVIALSIPDVLARGADDGAIHDVRHLGAFTVAYGVGLGVVVLRPARARSMLPVAAVLASALLVTAVVDLARGDIPLVQESVHLLEVVSVVLIWLLAEPTKRRLRGGRRSAVLPRRSLSVVQRGDRTG